jgi:hypothetical protein
MNIRQLSIIQHTNKDDLGNKTTIEIIDEKYILRFRWSITPNRNKIYIDVLLLDGDWRNLIVIVEKDTCSGFQFFNVYDTTENEWSYKMKEMIEKICTEIEVLKSKKWL